MKFVADDGKIFDTMEECEEYEKMCGEGREIATLWKKYITTYDKNGHVTESIYTIDEDVSFFLQETSEILSTDASTYIKISCANYEWEKISNYFRNEYGVYLPDFRGLWCYDGVTEEWIEFSADYEAFKKKWEVMGIHF